MTPRYTLRTLLILLAILPPLLWIGWGKYQAWRAEQERRKAAAQAAEFAAELDRLAQQALVGNRLPPPFKAAGQRD